MGLTQTAIPDLTPIRSVYPFTPHRLAVPGGELSYLDEGQGPAVIMLHGNPTWSFYYRRLISALRDRYRVIVPDHMGCGLSDKPQNYPYRLANHIENVSRLVRHLGITEATLMVHDWGGAIGMGYAIRQEITVSRLVIFNTAAFLSLHVPLRIAICKIPLFGDLAIRGLNAFALGGTFMAVERPMEPLVRQGYLLPYGNYHDRIANLRFVQDIPLHPLHPTWRDVATIERRLDQFAATPMLILWGGKDWCFDDHFLAGWMQRFPAAEVHRIDDAGHYVVEDAHAYIVPQLLRFLNEAPA